MEKLIPDLLFKPSIELYLGQTTITYQLDEMHPEFSFFPHCPIEVLDVNVYELYIGELHVI
jgi:hypothetical protein